MNNYIPLSVPSLQGNEWKYVKECLDTEWVSSSGKYVEIFEEKIAECTGSKYAIACVNGTAALQVSLILAGVQPGDEVIVPTLTFISPVNAIAYNNANPIFMDTDQYYNIDTKKTVQFIKKETIFVNGITQNKATGKRISAIIVVHVFGNAVWLDELINLCENRNITVVEDACESLGTVYKKGEHSGKHTGTIGKLGCLSFNGNKIITTGGGGMILTNDVFLAKKAKYLTMQAKDDGIRYIHDEIGYNFRLTNIMAALGVAQLEQLPNFQIKKKEIYNNYREKYESIIGLQIADVPDYADNNHWLVSMQITKDVYRMNREELMTHLADHKIETRPVWHLNHMQKLYKKCQSYQIERAIQLVENSLCLPSSTNLKEEDIQRIISCTI